MPRFERLYWLILFCWIISGGPVAFAIQQQVPVNQEGYQAQVVPFLKRYCVQCHGPQHRKADLAVDEFVGPVAAEDELPQWEMILEMLRSEAMPPSDKPQPSPVQRQQVVDWIERAMRSVVAGSEQPPRSTTTRRLSNFEYHNTMRDLLGFELNLTDNLPEDPSKPYRFNNTSAFLLMGREQLERYQENGLRAMTSAIVDPKTPEVFRAESKWGPETRRKNDEIAISGNRRGAPSDGLKITKWPETGEYRIRIQATGRFPDGIQEMPLRLVMGYGLAGDIGNAPFTPVGTIRLVRDDGQPKFYEFRGRIENHPWEAERSQRRGGTRTGNLRTFPANMVITPQNLFDDGTLNDNPDPASKPRAVIRSIEFEAPVTDVWPPSHHTRILFESPLRTEEPEVYVRQVLSKFLKRAFRRPVTAEELTRYQQIYQIFAADLNTMESAMRHTLAIALASPNFLYHVNSDEATNRHYEIANRLSYFLWGTMPDSTLLELADQGLLQKPDVVEKQVVRLLKDDRARDFISNFTRQWLSIDKATSIPINQKLFPRFLFTITRGERRGAEVPFRPTIRHDMVNETIAFVHELLDQNEPVRSLVDSDFAMLNQRLANHYGVPGVEGDRLRRVQVKPTDHLGGLLTQGSVLVGNSTGSAPHPIYRAVWLREAILGDEVRDPPADVPALSDSAGDSAEEAVTIKDLLAQHRTKESCADCHDRLDPWGIPFERYNAIGKFQPKVPQAGVRVSGFNLQKHQDLDGYQAYLDEINTVAIDASSQLPNGPKVDGLDELKEYLVNHRERDIARNVARRLLAYGLGRELTVRDRVAVESLLESTEQNGYRFRDLVVAICRSDLFLGK